MEFDKQRKMADASKVQINEPEPAQRDFTDDYYHLNIHDVGKVIVVRDEGTRAHCNKAFPGAVTFTMSEIKKLTVQRAGVEEIRKQYNKKKRSQELMETI